LRCRFNETSTDVRPDAHDVFSELVIGEAKLAFTFPPQLHLPCAPQRAPTTHARTHTHTHAHAQTHTRKHVNIHADRHACAHVGGSEPRTWCASAPAVSAPAREARAQRAGRGAAGRQRAPPLHLYVRPHTRALSRQRARAAPCRARTRGRAITYHEVGPVALLQHGNIVVEVVCVGGHLPGAHAAATARAAHGPPRAARHGGPARSGCGTRARGGARGTGAHAPPRRLALPGRRPASRPRRRAARKGAAGGRAGGRRGTTGDSARAVRRKQQRRPTRCRTRHRG